MARRKIVIGMMMHETNTFSPVPTPLAAFRPLAGASAIEEFRDTNTQLGGFLQVAQEMGAEVTVAIAAGAHPSGYVEKRAYEDMCDAIVGAIRGGCDAAFLALHGAMVAEHTADGEGDLLRRIRAAAPRLPVAVGLDFHAHMTASMVESPLPPYSFGHDAQIQPPSNSFSVHSSWNRALSSPFSSKPSSNQPSGRLSSSQARISLRNVSASGG